METIKKTCNIPERTAYRYLNTISEANIPVYFDRRLRAYRLAGRDIPTGIELSMSEALLVVLALKTLAKRVNADYAQEILAVVQKLVVQQSFPVEEILRSFEHQLDGSADLGDYSELLTSILINTAITCNRELQITTKTSGIKSGQIRIDQPALRFHKDWYLTGKREQGARETPLSDIRKVSIV